MQNGAFAVIREGLMWCAIFAAALLSFFYSGDIMRLVTNEAAVAGIESPDEGAATSPSAADSASFDRIAHLEAADNGHFYADVTIDGRTINVVVDTGATGVALTYEDAERIGLTIRDSDYTHFSRTANGTARIAPVHLDEVRLGDITVRNVEAYVTEPGALFATLLGMTFLSRLSRVDIRGKELVLVE